VAGATSYNLYVAEACPVTKDNYTTLRGGRRVAGVTSPHVLDGFLSDAIHCVAVTSVENGVESASSPSRVTPVGAWRAVGGAVTAGLRFNAVATGIGSHGALAAASGPTGSAVNVCGTAAKVDGCDVYRTLNITSWSRVTAGVDHADVRAIAAAGSLVFATTRDFFGVTGAEVPRLLRSFDLGTSWTAVPIDSQSVGETTQAAAFDPTTSSRFYASSFKLPGGDVGQSSIVASEDAGTSPGLPTFAHLPSTPFEELRAYAIAVDPQAPTTIYAGGSSVTNLARSVDGGQTWQDISPPGHNNVYAIAIHPTTPSTLYAGTQHFATPRGVFKSVNGGTSWTPVMTGLSPMPSRVSALVIDPADPERVYAGTDVGVYVTVDGGASWTLANTGLGNTTVNGLAMTPSRFLLAATDSGLYRLDLSSPEADLSVDVADTPDPVPAETTLTYSVLVHNAGPAFSTNVTLTFPLPPTVVGGTPVPSQGSCSGTATVTCSLGTVPPGADVSVTIPVTPTLAAELSATASVSSPIVDPVSANNSATATTTVQEPPVPLTVTVVGGGTVVSTPPGIECPGVCGEEFAAGGVVTLAATPAAGFVFGGWSGDCTGSAGCSVTLSAARSVTATFTASAAQRVLTVTVRGSGVGTVTSSAGGIACPGDCSQSYPINTVATLAANPTAGATVAWSGACSGSGACVVTLDAARSVTVTFARAFTDPTLTAGVTRVKAAHLLELREAVDTLRARLGLAPVAWPASPPLAVGAVVRAAHVVQLRDALQALGAAPPAVDPTLTPGVTRVKAAHVDELRARVRALE
jgi:uncharacterized repeat protein (TIGR01451 family)